MLSFNQRYARDYRPAGGIRYPGPERRHHHGGGRALDYYWPTTCDGQGICTSCASQVLQGGENLSPMGRGERRTLEGELGEAAVPSGRWRLACQARLLEGDVEVLKRGVRPPEDTQA